MMLQTSTRPALAHNIVTVAKHLVSPSGLVIPQRAQVRILGYWPDGGLIVDFHYLPVFITPAGSDLIEWEAK